MDLFSVLVLKSGLLSFYLLRCYKEGMYYPTCLKGLLAKVRFSIKGAGRNNFKNSKKQEMLSEF